MYVSPLVPPFLYHNLCGSVVLRSYIPVYIYMYIFSTLTTTVIPYLTCKYTKYDDFPEFIRNKMMGIMWPTHWKSKNYDNNNNISATNPIVLTDNIEDVEVVELPPRQLLKIDNMTSNVLHHISILLTFGLCCPALAVTICCYEVLYVTSQIVLIGRFIKVRLSHLNSNRHGTKKPYWAY
jgi:hypothetical protein